MQTLIDTLPCFIILLAAKITIIEHLENSNDVQEDCFHSYRSSDLCR